MRVELDKESGFCFGVIRAIEQAEQLLADGVALSSLGEVVHNSVEVSRLQALGLRVIGDRERFEELRGATVLIRAHGEPPSTYALAARCGVTLVDATCPVVLRLQERIRQSARQALEDGAQLVIFGQRGHAEVNGLVGQANGKATVLESVEEVHLLDFERPIVLYAQTTKSLEEFAQLRCEIRKHMAVGMRFEAHDTVCRQVAHRARHLRTFARRHDVVIFVSGHNSSNGNELHAVCAAANPRTHRVQDVGELRPAWFAGKCRSVGVCGATSTPRWLMARVAKAAAALGC
ncbi:MAG: 4-hydroxy-3-methylbut-2-enyl diphosphate reductase [Prevotellaceae bacterium]|jgi:4-hydroxy-3-methylbut-2-enyl diphosphate reductase|nr:4-hydroxy-3-methylbut-2-enyl diphosphate reductase [Prevotellaceae bacterium]